MLFSNIWYAFPRRSATAIKLRKLPNNFNVIHLIYLAPNGMVGKAPLKTLSFFLVPTLLRGNAYLPITT